MSLRLALGAIALALLACTTTGGSGGNDDSGSTTACDGELRSNTMSLTSDKDGQVTIPVTLGENDAAFMVMTEGATGYLSTDGVVDETGQTVLDWQDWSSSRESLTNAFYASEDVSVLNWPIRDADGGLEAGDWTVFASTLDTSGYPKANRDVDVTVLTRHCTGTRGSLPVSIVYAGGLESDRVVTKAVEAAALRWVEIYASIGVDLTLSYGSADMDASLPEPLPGGSAYTDVYDAVGEGVVLVVGEDVGGDPNLYGEAGGIPGAQIASPHSVVALGWLLHAGADGDFSDDEIEVMAETMAHESGHFLGLYHPVESTYDMWDALDDTKKCASGSSCDSALGKNLMYPYPICSGKTCDDQDTLTDEQSGVVHNNVGVR